MKRTPVKRTSVKGRQRTSAYQAASGLYLEAHAWCELGPLWPTDRPGPDCVGLADQVHHMVKRSQSHRLFADVRNFAASCYACNMYVEAEPAIARAVGASVRLRQADEILRSWSSLIEWATETGGPGYE